MRHRITYLREKCSDKDDQAFDPKRIAVTSTSLKLDNICGTKEHRLTFSVSDLPATTVQLLEQSQELHIRWASSRPDRISVPLSSRLPPGLHVFLNPRDVSKTESVCSALQEAFSEHLKCISYQASFSSPAAFSTELSNSTSSQYFAYLPSLAEFVFHLQQKICNGSNQRCQDGAFSLLTANSLDIDYDAPSQSLVVSAVWAKGPAAGGAWNDKLVQPDGNQLEVGVLKEEPAKKLHELKLGGFLTVLGQDDRPKPTLFSFPSRHHDLTAQQQHLSSTFFTHFERPAGLHPKLLLSIRDAKKLIAPTENCALYAYFALPSTLFIDRHAFSDPLFLSASHLVALRSLSGATDLEAPEWAVSRWGSAALFELALPQDSSGDGGRGQNAEKTHTIGIPLHARYLEPVDGGYSNISVPYPAVFWACTSEAEVDFKAAVNPFDRRNLGYDELFGDSTLFFHFQPEMATSAAGEEDLVSVLQVPVLKLETSARIEIITIIVVLLGFLWTCWKLAAPVGLRFAKETSKPPQGSRKGDGRADTVKHR